MSGPRKRRTVRSYHRWLGIIAALPLLLISLTGLLLNHTDDLGLDERHADADVILDRYGMALEGEPRTFAAGDHYISQWGDQLFFDGEALDAIDGSLVGAASLGEGIAVVLAPSRILLYDDAGSLMEVLGEATLTFGEIVRAGRTTERELVIEDVEGRRHAFAPDLLSFETHAAESRGTTPQVAWADPIATAPPDLRDKMATAYRGEGVSWYRVLLDMHTGKLFGLPGRYLADVVAVAVIVLVFTGLRLGLRSPK